MFKLIRRLFRWALYLFIIVVVVLVAAVLLLNTIVKQVVQSRLRSETGMDVVIGKIDVGLSTPTVAIEDVKIYNTPEFGGSLFLSVPEIFAEYDRDAIRSGQLHLNLLRVNLAELDFVKDKKGRLNFESLKTEGKAVTDPAQKQSSRFTFTGIDTLNLTLQKMRVAHLDAPRVEELNFGLTNQIFHHLKSDEDWEGMAIILAGRGGAATTPSNDAQRDLQKLLQQLFH